MTTISPQDVAGQFPSILGRVAEGEEFVVAENGRAVARIVRHTGWFWPETMPYPEKIEAANAELRRLVVPGRFPGGTNNEDIDRDLAREYDSSHK